MARDGNEIDSTDDKSQTAGKASSRSVGRRRFLQGVGAVVATTGLARTARADSNDVIRLQSGESRLFRSSQDDLSNTLVVPNGGSVRFVLDSGGRWENVGIAGNADQTGAGGGMFATMVPEGEEFVLDGYYTGGTTSSGRNDNGGHSFVFNSIDHAGDATFKNGFTTDWYQPYYCSNSGNPAHRNEDHAGRGGDIHFENLYTEKFAHTAYRLGTDGSTCVDCVAANPYEDHGPARSAWAFFNEPTYENLQFETYIKSGSRYDHPVPRLVSCNGTGGRMMHGDYQGDDPSNGADLSVPDGVPTSAEAAAAGDRS
ncbi:hypothetical protein SAMN04487947_3683 [Halogeometricum rufum]|uniref:Uncharacterized protein n=1 Tax=Halogeometricum rufum TaxID=553469 RepID=A0A1I6IST0_9EURY|nr:hypothetical protein [Halogeometricum rufum]SFR69792.1 hypothetical protein SAMN04487947_3683 [Halogeometricum rufum]